MLNENQINLLPERIYERLNAVNSEYLVNIGRIIRKTGELRPTDINQLQRMYDYGNDMEKVIKKLSDVSKKNVDEIYEIFDIVSKENYNFSKPFYKAKEIPFIPYEENKKLQSYVRAMADNTVNEYVNLTQHTAFAIFEKDGKSIAPLFESNKNKIATTLSDTYTQLTDYAVTKVQLGVESYNKAMKDVIKALAGSGIRTVDYATGYSRRLDTAVRQNILWGIKECNQKTADYIGEEFGADGYEISYHSHPRETHADMAGKQFATGEGKTVNGKYYPPFSDVVHLLEEYNCLHFKFSILLGISQPSYSDEQLEEFKENDKRTFEFEGKEYSMYEGTQLQRKIEASIRNHKDIAITAKAAGDDGLRREVQGEINILKNKYARLSELSGLPTKMERMDVRGFRSVKEDENLTFIRNQVKIKKNSGLPKQVSLPDEEIKQTVNVNFDFIHGVVPQFSKATKVYVMAGDGTSVPIRDIKRLYSTYQKSPKEWQKKSADVYAENYKYVVHWYEHRGFAPVDEFKVKGVRKL